MSSKRSSAARHAISYPSAMRRGWMPRSSSPSACSSSAPAITATPVVPSPISWSWLLLSSTISLPTWFSTSICSRMVAPSLAARGGRGGSASERRRAAAQVPAPARPPRPPRALTDHHVPVGPLQHLVHALGPQRGAQHARDRLGRLDVGLHRIDTLHPRLFLLLLGSGEGGSSRGAPQAPGRRSITPPPSIAAPRAPLPPLPHPDDDKGPPKIVKRQRHGCSLAITPGRRPVMRCRRAGTLAPCSGSGAQRSEGGRGNRRCCCPLTATAAREMAPPAPGNPLAAALAHPIACTPHPAPCACPPRPAADALNAPPACATPPTPARPCRASSCALHAWTRFEARGAGR